MLWVSAAGTQATGREWLLGGGNVAGITGERNLKCYLFLFYFN